MGKKEKIMLSEEELASRLQKLQGSSSTKKLSEAELTVKVSRLTNQEFSIPSASVRNCGRRSSSDELAELLGQITDEMKLEAADDMSGTNRVEEDKTKTTAKAKGPVVVLAKEMQTKASGLSEIEQFMLAVQDEELSDTCSENDDEDDEDNEEDHVLGKQGKKNNNKKKEKSKTAGTHASNSYDASQVQALLREAQKVEGSVVHSKLDVSEKEVAALLKSLDL